MQKEKQKPKPKQKSVTKGNSQKNIASKPAGPALKERLDAWCFKGRIWIIFGIVLISVAFRAVSFHQLGKTQLLNEHIHTESDMYVFDEWARDISGGDLLSRNYRQPEHIWMKWIADKYFSDYPDKYAEYRRIAGPDTTKNTPNQAVWTHWYGENVFPHEPFYAYFLAFSYRIFGHDVSWVFILQLLIGVLTNVLIYLITRRYFGDFAGCIAALMAVFFGPMMFFEMVLLRSSLAVFFTVLVAWLMGIALERRTFTAWILWGAATGLLITILGYVAIFFFLSLFFLGIFFFWERKMLLTAISGFILGTLLTISPVLVRNATVHAPLFSMSNNSAVGFITMNDKPFKSFEGWNADIKIATDIMAKSDGKLIKAILPTLRTHDNVMSYLKQVWGKFQATFSWFEIENNVNFYFYRALIPVLRWTFLSFLIISPLALAGIILSVFRKKKAWPFYLLIPVFLAAMLGFMVLSRYRIVFAGLLIPFAAYTVSQLFSTWKGWQNWLLVAGVCLVGFWCSKPSGDEIITVGKTDYAAFWTIHYFNEIAKEANARNFDRTEFLFNDFIKRYEPDEIKELKPYYRCSTKGESGVFSFFENVHNNLAGLYRYTGKTDLEVREKEIANQLRIAEGQ